VKHFFAISLSAVILFLSAGFTINSHHCGEATISTAIAIGHSIDGCGMDVDQNSCNKADHNNPEKKKNCCNNEFQQLKITGDYNKTDATSLNSSFSFLTALIISQEIHFSNIHFHKNEYLLYSPPISEQNIQVLAQIFLI
jgi:hypothetical protein